MTVRAHMPPDFVAVGRRRRPLPVKLLTGPYRRGWLKWWVSDQKAKHQPLRNERYALIRCDKGSGEWFYTEDELQDALQWYINDKTDWFNDVGLLVESWDGYGRERWSMDILDYQRTGYFVLAKGSGAA